MSKIVSAAEAKLHFADCVRAAERGESVVITRHGKAIAAVVPAADVEQLERLRASGKGSGLAAVAGGWRGSETLVARVAARRRTPPRKPPRLDRR